MTRIGFRFAFCYFVLYFLASNAFQLLPGGLSGRYLEAWDPIVLWLGGKLPLPYEVSLESRGIGNTAYGTVLFLCFLATAAMATAVWSVLDRKRTGYERLHSWLRLLLRFMLAGSMIHYGVIKAIPSQMTAPPPMGLMLFRIGDLMPNHLLWWTVGASPPFETLIGLAEILGGLLLLWPRTVLLGSLVCAANTLFIFLLNMCYDVPVKLPSFHLFVMAVVLIAPSLCRLADVFLFNRRSEPVRTVPNRAGHVLVALGALYLIVPSLESASGQYERMHPPRPPFHGIYSVEEFAAAGERWRWVSFLRPGTFGVEGAAGSQTVHPLDQFSVRRLEDGVLILEGQGIRAKLRRMPLIRDVPWPYKP